MILGERARVAILANLVHAHERVDEVGDRKSRRHRLPSTTSVVKLEVDVDIALVRHRLSVAHYEVVASPALEGLLDAISWSTFSGGNVSASATVEHRLEFHLLPLFDIARKVMVPVDAHRHSTRRFVPLSAQWELRRIGLIVGH